MISNNECFGTIVSCVLLFLLVTVCGCYDDAGGVKVPATNIPRPGVTSPSLESIDERASGRKDVSVRKKQTNMITESDAIDIAKKTIKSKATPQDGSPITSELKDNTYIITFIHKNPPGVKGADYDARVVIDVTTGEVKQFLVGP